MTNEIHITFLKSNLSKEREEELERLRLARRYLDFIHDLTQERINNDKTGKGIHKQSDL